VFGVNPQTCLSDGMFFQPPELQLYYRRNYNTFKCDGYCFQPFASLVIAHQLYSHMQSLQ